MVGPQQVRLDLVGGDALGAGDAPALSWWLPEGAGCQTAYQVLTEDGYDTGRVESAQQSFVVLPVFDRSRRRTAARVRVWTDAGESSWSEPVLLDSGLLHASDWTVSWVGPHEPQVPPKGERPAYWLRTQVDAVGGPAVVHVTALGIYEVFLNGLRVGDEELAPGFTTYSRRVLYRSHWVELIPGRNVIAVLLADGWYRGQVGMPRTADQFGSTTALLLQLEEAGAVLDGTWRSAPSHVLAADLIGGQREDRRALDGTLHTPGFDDGAWSAAVVREVSTAVVRATAPPVRRIEQLRPVSVKDLGNAHVVDLGQNINGWVRLHDLGPEGTTVTLRHGEHFDDGGDLTTEHLDVDVPIFPEKLPVGQVDVVVSAGREGDVFEPRFTTHGFQYVRVEGHPGLTADDITGVVVHSDLRRTGWFRCSDDRLNRLHEATVWSLRDNVCSIPTDCPQRERAGWTGDWQLFAPTAAFLYDVGAFTRSWLRDAALEQRADGCVPNQVPSPPAEGFAGQLGHMNGSAGWGDVVVSAPWDVYEAYGDVALLEESWSSACAWVDYAAGRAATERHPSRADRDPSAHETYLWDAGFHWGEWLEPDQDLSDFRAFAMSDKAEVATAYLHRSAATLVRIGNLIGKDVARYSEIAEGAWRAWQAEFLLPDGRLAVQSQASHVRALAFRLVPDELRAGLAGRLVELVEEAGTHLGTGFLSTPMLLPVLVDEGRADVAFALLRQDTEPSWLTMIDRGATTVWERWNGVSAEGVAFESLNHYSKGAVVSFLHRYVAGLRATAPGYRTFEVRPRPGGGLTSAEADLDTPYGRIQIGWRHEGDLFHLGLTVPAGSSGDVVLPDGTTHDAPPGRHAFTAPLPAGRPQAADTGEAP
jgi:alpha-L-rhamnosidase